MKNKFWAYIPKLEIMLFEIILNSNGSIDIDIEKFYQSIKDKYTLTKEGLIFPVNNNNQEAIMTVTFTSNLLHINTEDCWIIEAPSNVYKLFLN